jgi:hypothetical protein
MNTGTVTGGVIKGAVSAYTPGTMGTGHQRRVVFTIIVRDGLGREGVWNCEAEGDDATLDQIEAEAQPGRGVRLEYELATRPYEKRGVHVGEVRFLRVRHAEFAPQRKEPAEEVSA